MVEVDKVCRQLNLKYYMVGGTLLGAVRHKGFIPWDDDLDIALPRKDFNIFISKCQSLLPTNLKLLWITTDKDYWFPFAKVHNINTRFVDSTYKDIPKKYGIYVDLFPLDETNGYSGTVERRKKVVKSIFNFRKDRLVQVLPDGLKRKILHMIPNSLWNKIQIRYMTKTNSRDLSCYSNFASNYSITKQTMPKEFFGDGVELLFEGYYFLAPDDYFGFLSKLFGNDYMQLPPVEKRGCHYPSLVQFSDGEVLKFDVDNSKKVKFRD